MQLPLPGAFAVVPFEMGRHAAPAVVRVVLEPDPGFDPADFGHAGVVGDVEVRVVVANFSGCAVFGRSGNFASYL